MKHEARDMFVAPKRAPAGAPAQPALTAAEAEAEQARQAKRAHDFNLFRQHAAAFFPTPPSDEKHQRMTARNGYHFALGGESHADGEPHGLDPAVIEAFYGARPLKNLQQVSADRLKLEWTAAAETGAALLYAQGEDGSVTAFLYPATTDNLKAEEDAILLAKFTDLEALTGRGLLEAHWAAFRAYAEVTSLEGEPSVAERAHVAWLRLSRPTVVDGRLRPTGLWTGAQKLAGFALAVAVSALLIAGMA